MSQILLNDLKRESESIKNLTLKAIERIVVSADYILGKDVEQFEKSFAAYIGVKYCVGVSNGTAALFLALKALGIGSGDEVITTSMSFAATTEAIIHAGATPVFCDVSQDILSINDTMIEDLITSKTKAILPVHLYGIPANIEKINQLCKKFNLYLIEDCAQAHGAEYHGKKTGSFGDVGCFSFMPAKNIGAYGDAGCIVTDNEELAKKISKLRNHGRESKYVHSEMGYAERMDNMQAAVLNVKLEYLDTWNSKRSVVAKEYDLQFSNSNIQTLKIPQSSKSSYYTYPIIIENRDYVAQKLDDLGIKTGIYYPVPLHLQPAFANFNTGKLAVAEALSDKLLSLPMHPFLKKEEVDYIAKMTLKICQQASQLVE